MTQSRLLRREEQRVKLMAKLAMAQTQRLKYRSEFRMKMVQFSYDEMRRPM